jgi:hypothetical protein
MEFTNLDYFNYYLKEFCNELIANFPDFEKNIVANYRELLESKQSQNSLYAKYFVSKVNDYMDKICGKDETLFNPENYVDKESGLVGTLVFLEGIDFLKLWQSSTNNDANKQAIWKYLQLLVLLGRKVVPNNEEVMNILNSVGGEVYVPAKVEKTLKGKEEDLEDAGNQPDIFGLGGLAGMAGLAGLGSGEMPDLSSMVKTLGDALGSIDLSAMTAEMEKAQADAVNNMDNSNTEETVSSENVEDSGDLTNGCSQSNGEGETNTNQMPGLPNLGGVTGNLFTDLAKEMASTFDFSSVEKEEPKNMGEAFSKFMSGDNPAKLMGLVSKFGGRLQNDISSGKVNQADLLKDTTAMMAGLQGGGANLKKQAKKMAKNNPQMAQMAQQMARQQSGGSTKERLRAKLEAKRKAQQQQSPAP